MTYTNLVNVKDISHLEWLEYRQVGIGGSDAAALSMDVIHNS